MLGYLSKFVLQMLPTISATVIGAYIVTTWINPKTPPGPAKVAAQQAPKGAPHAAEPDAAAVEAKAEALGTEATPEVKAPETARPGKTAQDPIRVIPIVKPADAPVAVESASVAEERKEIRGANELARAAIQRLRGGLEAPRAAEDHPKSVAPVARAAQARPAVDAAQMVPATTMTAAPPLPPAVTIAAPRYPQADAVDAVAQPERLTPPGEIPTAERQPLSLRASHRVAENPSFADDVLSATKSFFRAITPQ
jgi:hypothetical protein